MKVNLARLLTLAYGVWREMQKRRSCHRAIQTKNDKTTGRTQGARILDVFPNIVKFRIITVMKMNKSDIFTFRNNTREIGLIVKCFSSKSNLILLENACYVKYYYNFVGHCGVFCGLKWRIGQAKRHWNFKTYKQALSSCLFLYNLENSRRKQASLDAWFL